MSFDTSYQNTGLSEGQGLRPYNPKSVTKHKAPIGGCRSTPLWKHKKRELFSSLFSLSLHQFLGHTSVFSERDGDCLYSGPESTADLPENGTLVFFPELRGIVLSALILWLKAHLLHSLIKRISFFKPSGITSRNWNIVQMQMGACFVHMNISPYELQIRVSLLKGLSILQKGFFGSLCPSTTVL